MELKLLREEVAKKKSALKEKEEYNRLQRQLYELNNPELISKQKAKAQKSAKFRSNVSKFLKRARTNFAQGAKDLNKQRSPSQTAKRMNMVYGSEITGSKSRQSEFSLI